MWNFWLLRLCLTALFLTNWQAKSLTAASLASLFFFLLWLRLSVTKSRLSVSLISRQAKKPWSISFFDCRRYLRRQMLQSRHGSGPEETGPKGVRFTSSTQFKVAARTTQLHCHDNTEWVLNLPISHVLNWACRTINFNGVAVFN